MVHEYGIEKEREILRANGINNRYDILSLKNFVLVKQIEIKNVSRIYELPDGKKIIMDGDNKSFMEGLLDDIEKSEMKNEILFYDKQIHLYEDLLTKRNLLSDDEINYMKNFSEMSCLDFHQKKGI